MYKFNLLTITTAIILLTGCAITNKAAKSGDKSDKKLGSLTDSFKNKINKEIDSMVEEWDKAAANKDANSLSKLYTINADILHYDNIQHVGRESIKQHFEKQFISDPDLKKAFSDHQRIFVTPKIVIETAKSHITGSKIIPTPPTRGRYTATYIKIEDRWLIVYERAWWTWPFKYD